MANMSPSIEGMVKNKKQESENKKKAVLTVLKNLILEGEQINKVEICRRAGVSKTFLYANREELLEPIEEAIKLQDHKLDFSHKNKRISENSREKIIESLKRKVSNLEEENKRLKKENAILLGKVATGVT